MNERCGFVRCVPIDTDIDDMDIIGSCTEAVVVDNGVVYEIKHGEGELVRRQLTRKEQMFVDEAARQIMPNECQ